MGKGRAYTTSTFGGPSYVSNFYSGQLYSEERKNAEELIKLYNASSLEEAQFLHQKALEEAQLLKKKSVKEAHFLKRKVQFLQHYESMTLEQLRSAWNSRIVDGRYRAGLSHDEVEVLRKVYLRMNGGKL